MLRLLVLMAAGLTAALSMADDHEPSADAPVAIAIHGGAGTILRENMTAEREAAIRDALEQAARTGHSALSEGRPALEAVVAAIRVLEDAPEFNAGRGAVLTNEGTVEMDASIMDGHTLDAGAVAAIKGVRHPIEAAVHVMNDSPHVMMIGEGAADFVRDFGLEFMDEDWFITDFRREQLEAIQADEQAATQLSESWYSTVGAVALDTDGNLAAATSTGGMSNKRWGRVGDSPIIGAGTYADNRSCAVSATGHGEYFIRHVAAYSICSLVRLTGVDLATAADRVINETLKEAGADGGVIAIDPEGRISMTFNTPGMYRAAVHPDGRLEIGIYRDEP